MNTFFKTFFVCLILCLGLIFYKYVGSDSYSPNIEISENNELLTFQNKNTPKQNLPVEEVNEPNENTQQEEEKQEYIYTSYFFSNEGKLVPCKRKLTTPTKLEMAITLLLKGPLLSETKQGIYSEIPTGTDLIYVRRYDNKIIVNLTSKFGEGGGTQSIENRIKQLTKTIKIIEPNKSIYLYINGKEVEYLGGDGVYVKQPL